MFLQGQQIDHYQILHLIGGGAMGEVYLAEDPRIEQQVAIKVIRAELIPYPNSNSAEQVIHLFQREAKAIAKLDHPHILPLFSYGEQRIGDMTLIYLVMPYRPEGSLAKWMSQRPQGTLLSPPEVAHVVQQAASALQHAHERGIIHQDVKPSNFLIRERKETPERPDLLLADFGIARLMNTTSITSQSVRGTPSYMAPEQCLGHAVPASDQYGLAVMAYELLTGHPLFSGASMQVMFQHIHTIPQSPGSFNSQLSKEVDEVILQALAKQANKRFASINTFSNAFLQAIQNLPSTDRTISIATNLPGQAPVSRNLNAELVISEDASTFLLPHSDPIQSSPSESDASTFLLPHSDPIQLSPSESDASTFLLPHSDPIQSSPSTPRSISLPLPTSLGVAPKTPSSPDRANAPIPTARSRSRPSLRLVLALVLLLVLVVSGSTLVALIYPFHAILSQLKSTPTGAASLTTVTITPVSKQLENTYRLTAMITKPDPTKRQVAARLISQPTPPYTKTVPATGVTTTPATHASGILTIYNYSTTSSATLTAGTNIPNGQSVAVDMILDGSVTVPPASDPTNPPTGTVAAHVGQAGTIGNLPAVNNGGGGFYYCTNCSGNTVNGWEIENDSPFSGGNDAQTVTVVQQQDINNASSALEASESPNAQQVLQGQVRSNERIVGTPQCSPNVSSDHSAGDVAKSVTLTVAFTCTGEVYDQQGALALATSLLHAQAASNPGALYTLKGSIDAALTQAAITDATRGTITLNVTAQGVWVFQFNAVQKQKMAALIANKTQQQAQMLLLSQAGVQQVKIQLSGGSNILSADMRHISIIVSV